MQSRGREIHTDPNVPLWANARAEGEHGLTRNDRMPVESAAGHERERFSLPAISNNYGNHYEPRFSHRFSCCVLSSVGHVRFLFHLRRAHHRRDEVSVPLSFILLFFLFCFLRFVLAHRHIQLCAKRVHVRNDRTVSFHRTVALFRSFPPPSPTFLTVKLSLPRLRSARVNIGRPRPANKLVRGSRFEGYRRSRADAPSPLGEVSYRLRRGLCWIKTAASVLADDDGTFFSLSLSVSVLWSTMFPRLTTYWAQPKLIQEVELVETI